MARIELDARLIVRLVEIERCAGRDLEERRILHRALRLRVENLHRSFPLVELIAEEIVVLLGFDLRLRTRPERLHRVQRAQLRLLDLLRTLDDFALIVARHLLCRHVHADRIAHVVGVLLYEALKHKRIRVVRLALRELLREVDCHRRAA